MSLLSMVYEYLSRLIVVKLNKFEVLNERGQFSLSLLRGRALEFNQYPE